MTSKTLRKSLIAFAVLAIVASFASASSFAGDFTVHHGKRYRAVVALKSVEQLVNNAMIAQKFRALGFSQVHVSGSGATRQVEGVWRGYKRVHPAADRAGLPGCDPA
jgi:hypothetical protein